MRIRRKYLAYLGSLVLLIAAGWYFFLYPEEPWIRYNFAVRADEIDALADFLENQSNFDEFTCVGDDVWLDKKAAPDALDKILQNHCRSARIVSGGRTDTGSFYYLGWRKRWLNDYWIAGVHGAEWDDVPTCSRWHKLNRREECVIRLSENWAIHYFNVTNIGGEAEDLAEDVVQRIPSQ
jgi:hypothetical protein